MSKKVIGSNGGETMIREAAFEDLDQIQILVKEVHMMHYEARPDVYVDVDKPMSNEYFNMLLENEAVKIFVKELENEIVAYIIFKVNEVYNVPVLKPYKNIFIDALAVKYTHRKKGYGKDLFDYTKAYGESIGANSVQLTVWDFNKAAIKFYESLGMSTRNLKMELPLGE